MTPGTPQSSPEAHTARQPLGLAVNFKHVVRTCTQPGGGEGQSTVCLPNSY